MSAAAWPADVVRNASGTTTTFGRRGSRKRRKPDVQARGRHKLAGEI
jgi:hypothetical protein